MPSVTFFLVFFAACILLLVFWIYKCKKLAQHAQTLRNRSQTDGNAIYVISQQIKQYDPSKDLPPTYSEVMANPTKYREVEAI